MGSSVHSDSTSFPGDRPGAPPPLGRTGTFAKSAEAPETAPLESQSDLIEQTRQQIQQITTEIQRLADSSLPLGEFFEAFLSRVMTALASQGGAIWMKRDGELVLSYQTDMPATLASEATEATVRHQRLLERVVQRSEAVLVPPRSGSVNEEEEANPTTALLVLAPLKVGREVIGLVEIFQRPGSGPTTQRGYLRFLVQMVDHAAAYLKNHELRAVQERQELLERLDRFIAEAHQQLDLKQTAFAIVNEGRKVTGVDRAALAIRRGRHWEILAVSGLDSVERRSNEIKWLNRLIKTVCQAGTELWYDGDDAQLAPQIEEPLHEYLDQSHTKRMALIPLFPSQRETDEHDEHEEPIGCLVFEQIAQMTEAGTLRRRVGALAPHASRALANSLAMTQLPMAGTLRALGRCTQWLHAHNLPTTVLVAAAIAAVVAVLTLTPMPFQVGSDGQLVPVERRDVFAPTSGIVSRLYINDDPDLVIEANAPLLDLTNEQLLDEINQFEGRQRQLEQRMAAIKRDTVENYAELSLIEEQQLQSQLEEARTELAAVRQSLQLKKREIDLLKVASPIEGRLIDWQVTQKLYRRYVQSGQVLVSLVDPEGPWRVELALPEKRLKHVRELVAEGQQQVPVTFVLASLPGKSFEGTVEWVDQFATVDPIAGNSVQVRVRIDKDQIPPEVRVAGARVTAKIDCGRRSAGYVLFHDVWETLQSRVLFWIW